MTYEEIAELKFTPIGEALPETHGTAFVYMKFRDGRIRKGMFYINGTEPTFASYGSRMTDVIAWAYRDRNSPLERKKGEKR